MATNTRRRTLLLDAAIDLLAGRGARGLTFRAIDETAGTPIGTASNYFADRGELLAQVFDRIGARLAPDPEVLARLGRRRPSAKLFGDYMRDIVSRLTTERDVTLALFELRLEASRNPDVARLVRAWQGAGFSADVAFHTDAGLPGGRDEVALFHYALDGLILDRLTAPIDPATTTDHVIDRLVAGLFRDVHPALDTR
ncbi:MAG: TetR family transcriptional regulator [Ilumatobacter sp.]|uniref:TetR/AcrR family transcriptional regulator n=1 Tax=Ilumatobacter sp. TaxID=1967498 RepID=UPI00329996B4